MSKKCNIFPLLVNDIICTYVQMKYTGQMYI